VSSRHDGTALGIELVSVTSSTKILEPTTRDSSITITITLTITRHVCVCVVMSEKLEEDGGRADGTQSPPSVMDDFLSLLDGYEHKDGESVEYVWLEERLGVCPAGMVDGHEPKDPDDDDCPLFCDREFGKLIKDLRSGRVSAQELRDLITKDPSLPMQLLPFMLALKGLGFCVHFEIANYSKFETRYFGSQRAALELAQYLDWSDEKVRAMYRKQGFRLDFVDVAAYQFVCCCRRPRSKTSKTSVETTTMTTTGPQYTTRSVIITPTTESRRRLCYCESRLIIDMETYAPVTVLY
jgi:hypothetical protein